MYSNEFSFYSSAAHVLVTGDFIMPYIDRNSWTVACESSMDAEFLDLISDLFISQCVSFPTRVREGQVPSLIELVFTNDEILLLKLNLSCHWVKVTILLTQLTFNVILK